MTKLDLLQRFYDRVWIGGAVAEAGSFFAPAAAAGGLMSDLALGPQEFHDFVAPMLEMLEVRRVTMEKAVEQGDWIAVMASFEATVRATGQQITGSGMLMARVEGDRIAEAFNCFDFLGFFERLGLLPEDALALCLTGQRLG